MRQYYWPHRAKTVSKLCQYWDKPCKTIDILAIWHASGTVWHTLAQYAHSKYSK